MVRDSLNQRGERGDLQGSEGVSCVMLLLINKTAARYGVKGDEHIEILRGQKGCLDELFENEGFWDSLDEVIGEHVEEK